MQVWGGGGSTVKPLCDQRGEHCEHWKREMEKKHEI